MEWNFLTRYYYVSENTIGIASKTGGIVRALCGDRLIGRAVSAVIKSSC